MSKTIEQCRANIQEFANKFKVIFDDEGQCGFGRECVGLSSGSNWVDYNPTKYPNHEQIKELYDDRLYEIAPPNAYHKHDCICVLGRGDDAIRELDQWIDSLKELNATIVKYETGATGIQAMMTGFEGYSIKIN